MTIVPLSAVSDEPCSPIEEIPSFQITRGSPLKCSPASGSDCFQASVARDQRPSRAVNRSRFSSSSSSSSDSDDDFESMPITKKMLAGRRGASPSQASSSHAAARSPSNASTQQQRHQQQFTPPDSGMRHMTPVGSPLKPSNPSLQVSPPQLIQAQTLENPLTKPHLLQSEASVLFESSPDRKSVV